MGPWAQTVQCEVYDAVVEPRRPTAMMEVLPGWTLTVSAPHLRQRRSVRRSRCPNPCVRELAVEPARGARSGVGDGSPGGGGHAAQMQVLAAHEPCPADDPGGALTLPVLDPGGAGGQVFCPSHPLPVLPRAFAALASRELAQGARLLLERARIGAVEVPAIVQGVGDAVVEAAVHESGHGTTARGHRLARALAQLYPTPRHESYNSYSYDVQSGRVALHLPTDGDFTRWSCGSLRVRGRCPGRRRWPAGAVRRGWLCVHARCAHRRVGRWR